MPCHAMPCHAMACHDLSVAERGRGTCLEILHASARSDISSSYRSDISFTDTMDHLDPSLPLLDAVLQDLYRIYPTPC